MKRHRFRPAWLAALLLSALLPTRNIQAQDLPRGQVIDKVTCRVDASQSYALFLPSNYSPEKKWPILYALDAGARGRVPVERFKDAAEKYGYIVAGSNNSRNGPAEVAAAAIRAMLADTRTRLSIDERRVYFTGFSGGARVAVSVGSSFKGAVAGVIGCGAGFPPPLEPSASISFVYFGTAGIEDFNFSEMKQLDRALEGYGIPHRLAIFQGGHDWPPREVCTEAIEWLELQAMRAGIQEMRAPLVDELFQTAVQRAAAAETSKRAYDAFVEYEALIRDFKGLRDVAPYQGKANQLRGSKEVKQAIERERAEEQRQGLWIRKLVSLRGSYARAEEPTQVLRDLNDSISDLRRIADRKENTGDRVVARRVLTQFLVVLNQGAGDALESKNYEVAAFNLSLATRIRPDNPSLFYNLACAYSLDGRRSEALAALKSAIDKGFADLKLLETDPDLDGLRKEEAFQKILAAIASKRRPVPRASP